MPEHTIQQIDADPILSARHNHPKKWPGRWGFMPFWQEKVRLPD